MNLVSESGEHRNGGRMIIRLSICLLILAGPLSVGAVEIPESRRSRESITRVAPRLKEELAARQLEYGSPIFIRIFKESMELELWVEGPEEFELFRVYEICAMSGDLGPKTRTGDNQAPEGFYFVTPGRLNPSSRFHLSFNLGYPNSYDRYHGRTGSALMVHGACVSIGCFAMTDQKIEEIYALADAMFRQGHGFFRVHVFPFRMTAARLEKESESSWLGFWRNLKSGYDYFEGKKRAPNVETSGGKYTFEPPK